MITLITGTPGSGKTMWIVSELVKLFSSTLSIFGQIAVYLKISPAPKPVTRDVFVHGIPDLDFGVPYTQVYCRSDLCDVCQSQAVVSIPEPLFNQFGECVNFLEIEAAETRQSSICYVENWQEWAADGSLIILDEVQRIWRPRSAGSAVPPEISALETHRHKGIDFWLISQSPKLLEMNIRRLVGRHIHLVASWKGRAQYEWPECHENTASTAGAVSRPYVLKKSIFTKYKSASVHTKLEKRPPIAIYVIAIAAVLLIWLGNDIYSRHSAPEPESPKIDQQQPSPTNLNTTVQSVIPAGQTKFQSNSFDFTPRVKSRAETAPAYDGMVKVQSVPFPETCSAWTTETEKHCRCLTDQHTPYDMPYSQCVAYARHEVYNPYRKPAGGSQQPVNPPPQAQPLQVAKDERG